MTSDNTDECRVKRNKFKPSEDRMLLQLIEQYGDKCNWNIIANEMENKSARQCRDRWTQFLNPNISKAPFTYEEDKLLIEQIKKMGTVWCKICKFFKNRSVIQLKNRYSCLKRHMNKENWQEELMEIHAQEMSSPESEIIPPPEPELTFPEPQPIYEPEPQPIPEPAPIVYIAPEPKSYEEESLWELCELIWQQEPLPEPEPISEPLSDSDFSQYFESEEEDPWKDDPITSYELDPPGKEFIFAE